jgi:transcriptional regulator with XRE-family HTH domain
MPYDFDMKSGSESIRLVFARNVKNYRNALQYTQEKLAEKAKLSIQTIKDIEGGRRWVSDDTLTKIAKALNTTEFQLLIPEKLETDRKYRKSSAKSLIALKQKLRGFLDDQFENVLNSGDFG